MVVCTNGVQPYHGDYEYTNAANKIYYMFWKKGRLRPPFLCFTHCFLQCFKRKSRYLATWRGQTGIPSIKKGCPIRNSLILLSLTPLQCSLNFFFFVSFYDVAGFNVIVVLDGQSALHTYQYFFHIILEAFQRA
jgi:hypothetical protein